MAGFTAAAAIAAALHHRRRSGEGQHIDLSQVESGMVLTGPATLDFTVNGGATRRRATRRATAASGPRAAPHNTYPTVGDDNWIMITCTTDAHWAELCSLSNHPDWRDDPRFATLPARLRHEDELDDLLAVWTSAQGRAAR